MLKVFCSGTASPKPLTEELPLSAYRREHLRSVRAESLCQQMLTAELLLIRAVRSCDPSVRLPLNIAVGSDGKPYFPGLPYRFSLSHSDEMAACAISDREVGMDLQKIRTPSDAMLRRFFSAEERRGIAESRCPDAAFTVLWCMKESYGKALGTGLRDLAAFPSFSPEPVPCAAGRPDISFWIRELGEYRLAVCLPDGADAVPDAYYDASGSAQPV